LARVVIASLVLSFVAPAGAEVSTQAPAWRNAVASFTLADRATQPNGPGEETLVCAVVAVGNPFSLTKEAFGTLLAHTGSDPQPYAFTGEPLDPNSGFQYHRARWMDPGTGRFTGMDSFEGLQNDPASLHKYLYVKNGPADGRDPSGLLGEFSVGGFLAAAALGGVLYSIATPNREGIAGGFARFLRGAVIGAGLYTGFGAVALFYRLAVGLGGGAVIAAASTGGPTNLPFKSGDFVVRYYQYGDEIIEVGGEAVVEGGTLILRGVMVYPQGKPYVDIGVRGVLAIKEQLVMEAQALGFSALRVTGWRTSGANPGKEIDVFINLVK
jgi:RHS repeat-associated protein